MCGIGGIIKRQSSASLPSLAKLMAESLSHRGPDGEGFLVSDLTKSVPCTERRTAHSRKFNYLPHHTMENAGVDPALILLHRRLSILDLSEAGHEPMCDQNAGLWITFNGEIYNYLELKKELEEAGCVFRSSCDTEVILYAYRQWGAECVQRFNGMWAFCLLDLEKKICFASRDRLGVKPFYYVERHDLFVFASEQKSFVRAGIINAEFDQEALHNYLVNGLLETSTSNFFDGVKELWPGHNLFYNLQTHQISIERYFDLRQQLNSENEALSDAELTEKVRNVFENAIRLRLRSDVEVGTCLSGGIDSSAIAVTIARLSSKPLHCFTAAFSGRPFNEGHYASIVADKIGGEHHLTEPTIAELLRDLDELVYSQDTPIWDTSTYAQHSVMALAKRNNIKVVLDGQGADELFTGYHHHFTARWNGMLTRGAYSSLYSDIAAAKVSMPSPFLFYLKEKIKEKTGSGNISEFLKDSFVQSGPLINPFAYKNDVNEQLIDDITRSRLKIFLKCEDRCAMWHSVESRTPFSDDKDLISLMFSFRGERKIKDGSLKYFLKEAVKEDLPAAIYHRSDKRGFETPMQEWIRELQSCLKEEVSAASFAFIDNKKLLERKSFTAKENKLLFKFFVLARWKKVFA